VEELFLTGSESEGSVSARIALVADDDRSIDGAADPSHADTAPASTARHNEREEKDDGPRGRAKKEQTIDGADDPMKHA
jgi:hypothetical protein